MMLQLQSLLVVLSTLLMSLHSSDAWFFFRKYPTAKSKGAAVDRTCLSKAAVGSCDFYSCFENRLSCGKNWYNVKYGDPYCRDFKAFKSKFTPEGQKFIESSEECMMGELLTWYRKDSMNCHDYTHFAFKALSRCYIKHGFCDVIKSDAINFITIYQPRHLFTRGALKIWREILRLTYHCEPKAFVDTISIFYESIRD